MGRLKYVCPYRRYLPNLWDQSPVFNGYKSPSPNGVSLERRVYRSVRFQNPSPLFKRQQKRRHP